MKISEYQKLTNLSLTTLSHLCDIAFHKMYRLSRGGSCTLATALKIEKKTKGKIRPKDLLSDKEFEEIYGTPRQEKE